MDPDPQDPQDEPEDPQEASGDTTHPHMPADPFSPAELGHALIAAELHGLQAAGTTVVEAALFTAARVVLGAIACQQQVPPDPEQP